MPTDPIRILPLGDSITQGGRSGREEFSYRLPLQKMLDDGGYNTEFIGSMVGGLDADFTWPEVNGKPFQPRHEGHYGWKTAAVRDHLAEWMKTYPHPADIALICLGGNDQDAGQHPTDKDRLIREQIVQPLAEIIAMLRGKNAGVVILVGHLPFNDGAALEIRPMVERMATELDRDQSPVTTVALYEGWKEDPKLPDSDTYDWAHPNPRGQAKMAAAWFDVITRYLKSVTI